MSVGSYGLQPKPPSGRVKARNVFRLSGSSLPMETITYNAVEQAISGIELVAVEDFESLKLEGSMRHIMGLQERSKLAWPLAAVLAELQYAPVA